MLNKACHVDQLFLFDLLIARPVGTPALPADYISRCKQRNKVFTLLILEVCNIIEFRMSRDWTIYADTNVLYCLICFFIAIGNKNQESELP